MKVLKSWKILERVEIMEDEKKKTTSLSKSFNRVAGIVYLKHHA